VNNILLFVDLSLAADMNLSVIRTIPSVIGVAALVFGFIWEAL
jgi:hypothetical protein